MCYVVKPGDTLWDIAKKFYTTTDSIRQLNELGEGEPAQEQPLLIVKKPLLF